MEQIFISLLTDLKAVYGHLLLRATHSKLPLYRQQIQNWKVCNSSHIKVLEEADSSFNQNKIQLCSVVEYNNNRKSVENLYCGPYTSGVIPFALSMHQNKIQPYLDFLSIRPFKFKVRPYIKIQENLVRINKSKEKLHNNQKQQNSSDGKSRICKKHQASSVRQQSQRAKQYSFLGKGVDQKPSQVRKCYCCSNRSDQDDESNKQDRFQRSPIKLKFQKTGRVQQNNAQQNVEKDQGIQKINNYIYLPVKGKDSTSSRNQSSPSLRFHAPIRKLAHPTNHASSGGLDNLIASSRRYGHSNMSGQQNILTPLSNQLTKSKKYEGIDCHNSASQQRHSNKVKPIKLEKYLLVGAKGPLSNKKNRLFDDQQAQTIKKQKISLQKHIKNQIKINQISSSLRQNKNQLVDLQRFSEMVQPVQESKMQLAEYSQDQKIIMANLVQPKEAVKEQQKRPFIQTLPKAINQTSAKINNVKELDNSKSLQKKDETLFTKRNVEQNKNYIHKQQAPLKLPNSEAKILKSNGIKKIPLAQKMQMIKIQQQKQNNSIFKDKASNNKMAAQLKGKTIQSIKSENNKQDIVQPEQINKSQRRQKSSQYHQARSINQQPQTQEDKNINLQKQNTLFSFNNQIAEFQCKAKKKVQQTNSITQAEDDFSMTQQRIINLSNILQIPDPNSLSNEQKISGNAASMNDDALTIKEFSYQQEEVNNVDNNQIQNSQIIDTSRIDTSRTIPYWSQHNTKQVQNMQNKPIIIRQYRQSQKLQKECYHQSSQKMQLLDGKGSVSSLKIIKSTYQQRQYLNQIKQIQKPQQIKNLVKQPQIQGVDGTDDIQQQKQVTQFKRKLALQAKLYQSTQQLRDIRQQDPALYDVFLLQDSQKQQIKSQRINKQGQEERYQSNNIIQIKQNAQTKFNINKVSQQNNIPQQGNFIISQVSNNQISNITSQYQLKNGQTANLCYSGSVKCICPQGEQLVVQNNNIKSDQQRNMSLNQQQAQLNVQADHIIQNKQIKLKHTRHQQTEQVGKQLNTKTKGTGSNILISQKQIQELNQHIALNITGVKSQQSSLNQMRFQEPQIEKLQSIIKKQQSEVVDSNKADLCQIQNTNQQNQMFNRQIYDGILNQAEQQKLIDLKKSSINIINQNQYEDNKISSYASIIKTQSNFQTINEINQSKETANKESETNKIQKQNIILTDPIKQIYDKQHKAQNSIQPIDKNIEDKKSSDLQIQLQTPAEIYQFVEITQNNNTSQQILDQNYQHEIINPTQQIPKESISIMTQKNKEQLLSSSSDLDKNTRGQKLNYFKKQQYFNQQQEVKINQFQVGDQGIRPRQKQIFEKISNKGEQNVCFLSASQNKQQSQSMNQRQHESKQAPSQYNFQQNQKNIINYINIQNQGQEQKENSNFTESEGIIETKDNNRIQQPGNNQIMSQQDKTKIQEPIQQQKQQTLLPIIQLEKLKVAHNQIAQPQNNILNKSIMLQEQCVQNNQEGTNLIADKQEVQNKLQSVPDSIMQNVNQQNINHVLQQQPNNQSQQSIVIDPLYELGNEGQHILSERQQMLQNNINDQINQLQNKQQVKAQQAKIIRPESQQMKPKQNSYSNQRIGPEIIVVRQQFTEQKLNNQKLHKEINIQQILVPQQDLQIVSIQQQNKEQKAIIIPELQNTDKLNEHPNEKQQIIIPHAHQSINEQNNHQMAQLEKESNHSQSKKQSAVFVSLTQNTPIQICDRNSKLLQSKKQKNQRPQITDKKEQNIKRCSNVKIQSSLCVNNNNVQERKNQYVSQIQKQQEASKQKDIKSNIQDNIFAVEKLQIQNQKKIKQHLSNTVSVQTDELLKSFKEIETSQFIDNTTPIYDLQKQHKIQTQQVHKFWKQIKKQKLIICDPQFAILNSELSKKQIQQTSDMNSGVYFPKIQNINVCQQYTENQPQLQTKQQTQKIKYKSNYKTQTTTNQDIFYPINRENTENIKLNQQTSNQQSLNLGLQTQKLNYASQDQLSKQFSSLSKKQIQLSEIQNDKKQQINLSKAKQLKQREDENQKYKIDLINEQQIKKSHPLIVEKIVNNLTSVVQYNKKIIPIVKGSKKQLIIDNAISFIEYNFPEFTSLLVNEQKTQICIFVEGGWIIYKTQQSSQTFCLKNVLSLALKEQSIFKCIDMMTGMPMRILKDKQQGTSNKRLLKSIKTLLEKKENQEYEKILYSIGKSTHELVCLQKIRNFLDKNNEVKTILQCKKFNKQQRQSQHWSQTYNLQGQSAQQFVQIHFLQYIKYLTFEVNRKVINTHELQLSNVLLYLNGSYKFLLYQEFNKNEYKLIKESYKWICYRCPEVVTKFLLIIQPIPDQQGQDKITLRVGLNTQPQLGSIYRLISSQTGEKTRDCEGGYQNTNNLYLPVIKQIKAKQTKHNKMQKQ